jgi:hypothetical protein
MEEGEISCNKVVRDTCRFVQDIDLAVENILCLFICVLGYIARGPGLDSVEPWSQVGGGVGCFSSDSSDRLDKSKRVDGADD